MKPSAAFLVLSHVVNTGLKFAIFTLFANFGGIEVAGSYTLGLAVVSPIFLFFNLGLREIYVTEKTSGLVFQHVLLLRFSYSFLALITSSVVGFLFFSESAVLIFWMSVYRYSEVLLDVVVAYFQRRSSAAGMACTLLAFSVSTYATMGLVFFLTNNIVWAAMLASVMGVIIFIIALAVVRPLRREVSMLPSKVDVSRSFKQGIMLSFSSFAVSMSTNTPVLFIEMYHSTEEVGFYSAIYHITTVSNILYSSISQLELRTFALAVQKHAYKRLTRRWAKVNAVLTLTGFVGAVILSIIGLPLFEIVFGQDFTQVYSAILAMGLVICVTPSGFLLDAQMVALQKYAVQSFISIVALLGSVLFSFLLIPPYAVLGGVLVVLISLLFRNTLKYFIVKKEIRSRTSAKEVTF